MNYGLKNKIIKLRKEKRTYNEIQKILNCSKSTISYHCCHLNDNSELSWNNKNLHYKNKNAFKEWDEQIKYQIKILYNYGLLTTEIADLFTIEVEKIRSFCKQLNKPQYSSLTNYEKVKRRRKKIKILGVLYLGGKCQQCGYNKYFENLEFHHLNPSEKEFTISKKCNHRWLTIKKELSKCIILCSTCHRELHAIQNNSDITPVDFILK